MTASTRVGYMRRLPAAGIYYTREEEHAMLCLARAIFGPGDYGFSECNSLWWVTLCVICPWLDVIDLLDVWRDE